MGRRLAAFRGALSCLFAFTSRGNAVRADVAMALLAGLVSLLLGQDDNWDLRNYHLHNAWAVLNGRLGVDLAPAQLQSYFVPWLDMSYYLLAVKVSPLLAGFVLGVVHGLSFALVAAIAWRVLEADPRRTWLAPLLGLAGCCSSVFLSELGGTMGDNTTAPLVLGSLLLCLNARRETPGTVRRLSLAGLLLGLALAFKLTNAIYALGLGVALLACGGPLRQRAREAAVLTAVTTLVFAVVAGPWFWRVWQQFGNPLFPQLNGFFGAAMAQPISVADTRWLPKSVWQMPLWPLRMTFDPALVSEIAMRQVVWALLWLLAMLALLNVVLRRLGMGWVSGSGTRIAPSAARRLGIFVAVSFVAWLCLFGIHRYLAVLELLAPLLIWVMGCRVLPAVFAERISFGLVTAGAVVAVLGWNTWGHASWTRAGFEVDAPALASPEKATLLLVGGEPQAWRLPFLPASLAYASVGSNFPASPAYERRVHEMAEARGGDVFALFPVESDGRAARLDRINAWAGRLGWTQGDCRQLRSFVRANKVDLQAGGPGNDGCRLVVAAAAVEKTAALNRLRVEQADTQLSAHGWRLLRESCTVHGSRIGDSEYPFRWCQVTRREEG